MMRKKKICIVIASPLSIHFYMLGYITVLAKEYDLTVITNTDDQNFLAYLGVPLKVTPLVIERNVSLWRDLKALTQLFFIFYRERFDLVHSLSPKSGLLAMIAAWIAIVPVRIHTFQGEVWITRKGLWRSFLKFLDKLVARCATNLLVVSFSELKFLVEQGVVSHGKSQVLANGSICGVDTVRFKPDFIARSRTRASLGIPESDTVILYLGRLTMDKGLLDQVDAFSRVAAIYENVHLLVVGPDEEGMQKKMKIRCVNGLLRLHFADYTASPEHYMAGADILCLPSYREGFGLVLIEAAATGLATIGSRIYGITDAIVENETGLLFTAGDVGDLTNKIEILIEDPTLRRVLGENGQVRINRDFSKELVLSELLRYYKNLLSV
jgi:glycosyltransferase involved in cell wall biosynthesis